MTSQSYRNPRPVAAAAGLTRRDGHEPTPAGSPAGTQPAMVLTLAGDSRAGERPRRRARLTATPSADGAAGWDPRWEPRQGPVPSALRRSAEHYERCTEMFAGWRTALVELLGLRPGDTVVDVGCGPGLNLPALRAAVGPTGTIIALDDSAELLAVAAHQVGLLGWDNVELINAPATTAQLAVHADAMLFAATPRVLACPDAVAHILGHLRAGAAIAAGGWTWPTHPRQRPLAVRFSAPQHTHHTDTARADALDRPWRHLAAHVTGLHITELGLGAGYLAHARYREPAPATGPPDHLTDPPERHPRW
jgi:hypothetical protein